MNISELHIVAQKHYQQGEYNQVISILSKIIDINPLDGQSYHYRGATKATLKEYKGAIQDFDEALRLHPNNEIAYFNRGKTKNILKDYEGAIQDFTNALRVDPSYVEAYYHRGVAIYELKNYELALRNFIAAIQLEPNYAEAYNYRGSTKKALSDINGAIQDYSKAIELNPNNADTFNNRGLAKSHLEDYEEAIIDFTEAIRINPNFIESNLNRSLTRFYLKQYYDAIQDCTKVIKINPNIEDAYSIRGSAEIELKQFERAVTDFTEAIRINPNNAHTYYNRGTSELLLKRYERAIVDYAEAIRINPDINLVFELLGELFYDWKFEIEKSICCLRICTIIEPNSPKYLWKVAQLYIEWQTRNDIEEVEFFNIIGPYADECKNYYIDEGAFNEKTKIAQGFFSKAFINSFQNLRTDLNNNINEYEMILFVGQSSYMFSNLKEQMFYFSDVRSFADKSDCPLLQKINQTDLIENVCFDNVRVRCLCYNEKVETLYKMWADYVNHKGLALRINIKKDWLIENEIYSSFVKYTPEQEIIIKCDSPEQVIQDGLFIKHNDHHMEKEWRMVKFGEFDQEKGIKVGWAYKDKEKGMGVEVKAVYMGIDILDSSLQKTIELAKEMSIHLYQIEIGPNSIFTAKEIILT
jgi:tetratricopeptide (TPR) repeat protein